MAPLELPFVTLDVFATERYKGNPLAVVTIPADTTPYPTQDQKQRIAQEFNLSETVFVHERHPELDDGSDPHRRHIDIFITDAELPFAGHPTVGTAVHLLPQDIRTIVTKAGPIPLKQPRKDFVQAAIPHNTHLHAHRLKDLAPGAIPAGHLCSAAEVQTAELAAPIFSIVKGMSFCLVELPSLEALASVDLTPGAFSPEDLLDEDWVQGIIGRYYYVSLPSEDKSVAKVRSRMILSSFEDPATGSAACALSSFLSLQDSKEDRTVTYQIDQGVEMGRESNILVEVATKGGKIDTVSLAGTATQVMRGFVTV